MRTARFIVTREMIETYARGCSINNPITAAIKSDAFPGATEIVVLPDEVYIDRQLFVPTLQTTRWIVRWNQGLRVKPSELELRPHNQVGSDDLRHRG